MDHLPRKERDFVADLESGGVMSDELGKMNLDLYVNPPNTIFSKVCSGFLGFDEPDKGENGVGLGGNVSNTTGIPLQNLDLVDKKVEGDEAVTNEGKKSRQEKRKSMSAKKPPRPPKALSLDAADQKLIKEISQLLMMKRVRTERMKALKRMKAAKASSSTGNLFALIFTFLFCVVVVFQGMSAGRKSAISFRSSDGLISVHYQSNTSTTTNNTTTPGLLAHIPILEPNDEVSRAAG